jgi:thioesterase domain-containing protein
LRVVPDAEHGFAIEAPVARNHNHLETAFGGSINAVATLAGYAFLWLELGDATVQLVIRASQIRFLRPVRETIRAVCLPPANEERERFWTALRAAGKARLDLQVQVKENGVVAAEFDGSFVALADADRVRRRPV